MTSDKMKLAKALEDNVHEVIEVKTSRNKIHVRCELFCPQSVRDLCEDFGYTFYNVMYQGEWNGENVVNVIFRKI